MKARVKVAYFDGTLHKKGDIVDVKKLSNLVEVIEDSVTKTEVKKTVVKVEEETEPVTEVTETVEKKPRKRTTKKRK